MQGMISKKIRKEKGLPERIRPPCVESPFGKFPSPGKTGSLMVVGTPASAAFSSRVSPERPGTAPTLGVRGESRVAAAHPVLRIGVDDLEATRSFLLKTGKFQMRPSKLVSALETGSAAAIRVPGRSQRRATAKPPRAGAWRYRVIRQTLFRKYYERGDLPIHVDHRSNGNAIKWKVSMDELDYGVYLPIFFDGVREVDDPFRFLAIQAVLDSIEAAPERILPTIPQLILPIKLALDTRVPAIICPLLKLIQQMILRNPAVGEALVPYYRQILPIFNLFRAKNLNLGDEMDYSQRNRLNLGTLIAETLDIMHQYGGVDAFINIKYHVPAYESCI
jgi:hypothetical protein